MKRNAGRNILLVLLAVVMLVTSGMPALASSGIKPFAALQNPFVETYNASSEYEVVRLTDASKWSGNIGNMDTVEHTTTFTGVYGAAVYKDLIVENELIQFKAKFHIEADGWVGFKFRSNSPSNELWDNDQSYGFVMKANEAEIYKVVNKTLIKLGSAPFVFADEKYHEYQLGVYDTPNGVNLVLIVDGTELAKISDNDEPIRGSSTMSINLYRDTTIAHVQVYSDGISAFGGMVDRTVKAPAKTLQSDHYWSIVNSVDDNAHMGEIPTLDKYIDEIELTKAGGAVYKNPVAGNVYSFSVSSFLDARGDGTGATVVLFRKQNRDSLYGDNSYGLKITQDGRVGLIKFTMNGAKLFGSVNTGLDFSKRQNIVVEVVEKGNFVADIYVYINSTSKALKYTDDAYSPYFEGPGFIGLVNLGNDVISTLGSFKFEMEEYDYEGDETEVLPVYFADYFAEADKQYLHWVYRSDFSSYTGVIITDPKGDVVGTVNYPKNSFDLKDYKWSKIYLTAVSNDGYTSEPVEIDLNDKRSQYYAEDQEKIVIKDGKFVGQDTGKPFTVNGMNYIGLRYGDHSTFEPEFGMTDAYYDYRKSETLLKTLSKHGYNTVRVFIIPGGREDQNLGLGGIYGETEGLYVPYMENFVDFLKRAQKYGIYVLPCFGENEMVHNEYFNQLSLGAEKQSILFTEDGIQAKKQMIKSFLTYIRQRDESLLDTILGLSMQNEFAFYSNAAPFNVTTGTYTFLDGTKYDMTDADSRRALANAALQNYYKEMKQAIHSVDSEMLLAEGTYTLLAVFKNYEDSKGIFPSSENPAHPMTAVEYLQTEIDFLDMHVYRYGQKGTAEEVFQKNFESMLLHTDKAKELMKVKPIIMGEYAAFSSDVEEQTLEQGKAFAMGLRDEAMAHGFQGALYWTVDTFEQTNIWALMQDGGAFLEEMSLLKRKGTK